MSGDTYYNNVSLLLHGDGADGGGTFTDNSPSPKTPTVTGSVHTLTAQSKWGGASIHFAASGDYLSYDGQSDFTFGTGDFTVEGWLYTAWNGADAFVFESKGGTTGNLGILFSTTYGWGVLDGAYTIFRKGTLTANTWTHFAVSRASGNLRLFVNGTQAGTTQTSTTNIGTASGYPKLGSNTFGFTGAYLDDFRVTKGIARYTANFTPPVAAFPNVLAPAIVGASSVVLTPSATLHSRPAHHKVGASPVTVRPTSGMHLSVKYALVGASTVAVTPNSGMHVPHFYSLVGAETIDFGVQSGMHVSQFYSLVGALTDTFIVQGTTSKYKRVGIVGQSSVSAAPSAVFSIPGHKYSHTGQSSVSVSPSSATEYRVVWTAALNFAMPTISATMHAEAPNTLIAGFVTTTLEALAGANLSGGFVDTTLAATGTLTETMSLNASLFTSTLSASATFDERITASFGFISSTLTALGGANAALTAPEFSFSATATADNIRATASLDFISTTLSASGTLEQRMSMSGGFIDTYLSYCSLNAAGPMFSLTATMSETTANSVAYVMNIDTNESWKYSNYTFMHIIHIGGKPYGVKSDGLYLLEGATDNGTAINATITTKETDFGTYNKKRLGNVYANSDTDLNITPYYDGTAAGTYHSINSGRKTKMPLGVNGRYIKLKIDNIQKLEGIEILTNVLQKRV